MEEPARNFPRGLAIVVPLAALIYFLPMAAGLAALGNWQEWQTAYLVTAGRLLGGSSMGFAMFAGAALCAFVLLDATVLSVSRVPFTMAPGGRAGLAAVVVIPTVLFAWALINSDPSSRLWGIACLALGPLAYYFAKRRQAATNPGAAPVDGSPRING